MKNLRRMIMPIYPSPNSFHWSMLAIRTLVSVEMMVAHGLKKIGIGGEEAEKIPNPFHLPDAFNQVFATAANLFFPVLVILGLFTRLAILPILAVTLIGYFVVHWNDSLLEKDMPFMYSVAFLLLFILGPGKYSADHIISKKLKL